MPSVSLALNRLFLCTKEKTNEKGFGWGSMLAALAIVLLVFEGFSRPLADYRATPRVNEAAAHMEKVSLAAASYLRDHYAELTTSIPLNGSAMTLSFETIQDAGYLSQNLSPTNPYGQGYSVRVRYTTQGAGANTRDVLEPLVLTVGGQAISDRELLRIAGKLEGGGAIRTENPALAIGNNGGWEAPLASFGGSPGAGHLAVGMFYSDAGMLQDYLYRHAVPGRPEVNQMATDIDMDNHALSTASIVQTGEAHMTRIVTQADACAPDGAVARDSQGNPMSCQNAVWTHMAAQHWIDAEGQRMRFTAANGQAMWLQNINGRFRWLDSALSNELASVDQSGNLTAAGRLRGGEFLQLDGIAAEGDACSPDGLIGRTSDGLILSCQSGVWSFVGSRGVVLHSDWPSLYGGRCAQGYDVTTNSFATACYDGATKILTYSSHNSNYWLPCDMDGRCWNSSITYNFSAYLTPAGILIQWVSGSPIAFLVWSS